MSGHLTRELLAMMDSGEADAEDVVRQMLGHLLDLCPTCREEFEAFNQGARRPTVDVAGFVLRGLDWIGRAAERAANLDSEASAAWAELRPLSPGDRRGVTSSPDSRRFANPRLIPRLFRECRKLVVSDPAGALEAAELAEELALRLDPAEFGREIPLELVAEAKALRANAIRAGGDLRTAEDIFCSVETLIRGEGLTDLGLKAQIWSLLGSLRKDQRRLPEAQRLLERAISASQRAGDSELRSKINLNLADVLHLSGRPREAAVRIRWILPEVDRLRRPYLRRCALGSLVRYELAAGRVAEARGLLEENRNFLLEPGDASWHKQVRWLEARLLMAEGDHQEAEAAFTEVRELAISASHGYDVALVSLDLATLYAEQSRIAELNQLAEQTLPILRSLDLHREALTAWLLFERAAQAECLTTALVGELATYYRFARNNPRLRFEAPG